jgi:hypothetical protein
MGITSSAALGIGGYNFPSLLPDVKWLWYIINWYYINIFQ